MDGLTGLSFSLLAYNKMTNGLEIMTTKHKDLIFDQSDELVPLLTIETSDLQKDIWKIINWDKVAEKLNIVQSFWNETFSETVMNSFQY